MAIEILTSDESGADSLIDINANFADLDTTKADINLNAVSNVGTSTDNAIARFDSTTGKVIQNSGVTIDDSNNINGSANLTENYFLNRQAIINGNFDVWQRGTSFDNPNAVYTVDRFKCINGVDTNVKVLRSTDVPNSSSLYSMRTEVMTATGGASSISYIIQKIEDYSKFVGKVVTLSVWAKCDAGVSGSILIQDDVGGSSSTAVSATTWTKYTASYTVNTGITYLQVVFNFPRDGITVGKGIYFSQVQLCAGSVALPFQPKSFAEELRDCQRYYETNFENGVTPGDINSEKRVTTAMVYSSTVVTMQVPFKVNKRVPPTMTLYTSSGGTAGTWDYITSAGWYSNKVVVGTASKNDCFTANITTTGATPDTAVVARGYWTASAEL